jgi:MFS family permease
MAAGVSSSALPLGQRFVRLWAATATANIGDGILLVGFPLLAVGLTRSPWQVSLITTLATAPRLLGSLHAGAIADRHDRRSIMLAAMLGRVGVLLVLLVASVVGTVGLGTLYAVAFVLGMAEVFADTTAQSILPMVVTRDQLGAANGRVVAAQTVANDFLGGPIAGVLAGVGTAAVAGVPAATYLVAGAVLSRLPGRYRPVRESPTAVGTDIIAGLRYVSEHGVLRAMAVLVGLINLAGAAYMVVFVLWAVGDTSALGLEPREYGLLMAALAVGGTAGAIGTERLGRHLSEPALLRISAAAFPVLFLLPVWLPTPMLTAAAFVAIGVAAGVHKVVVASVTQQLVPDGLLGRVNATMRLLGLGTMPVGALLGGALGSAAGLRPVFYLTAALCLVGILTIWTTITTVTIEAARITRSP